MLFDLKGKRRRTVQATYVLLAVLMGAGLVLFGIGSSVNGGLGDLFKGGNGSNQANQSIQKKIDAANKVLLRDPKNAGALAAVTRGHYQLATSTADPQTSQFTGASLKELMATDVAWQRYLGSVSKPDPTLGRLALQAYDGLGQLTKDQTSKAYYAKAASAAELVATAQPTAQNYVGLVQYATLAGQTRKATLAGQKAIALAPKAQKQAAKQAVTQAKTPPTAQSQGATTTPAP